MMPLSTLAPFWTDDVTAPSFSTADPPARTGIFDSALQRRGQERFSGTLRIEGGQAGAVTMRDGLVVAAGTPAAPGPESLLLRSGRISEADWTDAFAAAAPHGRMAAELVDRGLLGAAGLQVLTQVAVVDAVFAMALCGVRTCTAEPYGEDDLAPLLPADPGLDAHRLVRETARRLAAASQWREFGLEINRRPHPAVPEPVPPDDGAPRGDVLSKVNGRRTVRDIAFSLGRGLYSVMHDLATLTQDGLITFEPQLPAEPATPEPTPEGESDDLPRRRRGASEINTVLPWPPPVPDLPPPTGT
ncbi:hypothetical protein GCM10010191_56080 [Actinomadura vinacea]|uniref:MarR family transcriptional regulator n=1 Tax=Actinomadura vinacea TaxID=115336 RepID=A0ABP5WRK0_9ACTN